MDREVLEDCKSEQIRALIDEHNRLVTWCEQIAEAMKLPPVTARKIIAKRRL